MRTIAFLTLALSLTAFDAAAQSEAELKQRFAQRMSQVQQLKDSGAVGETIDGMLAIVSGGDANVQQLVTVENQDRAALYAVIAKRTGESPAAVAQQAAIRNYQQAKPEHFLRLKDGRWVKKKEIGAQQPAT